MNKLPEVIWVGKKSGEWPLYAFASEESAARWANGDDEGRSRYIWRIDVGDPQPLVGAYQPEQHSLIPVVA